MSAEQDIAAGGVEFRKVRLQDGTVATASLFLMVLSHSRQEWAYLRFKAGGKNFRRYVGNVTADTRELSLAIGWRLARKKKVVENSGWTWLKPTKFAANSNDLTKYREMTNATSAKRAAAPLSRQGHAALEQDTAAGGRELRKLRTKGGDVVTVSLAVATHRDRSRVTLRFKFGGSTVTRLVQLVPTISRSEALKMGWKTIRSERIVEKEGWSWVAPTP